MQAPLAHATNPLLFQVKRAPAGLTLSEKGNEEFALCEPWVLHTGTPFFYIFLYG